ncbi:hypothetical protein T492DRAFT_891348 [Pavlovales sp. CCMP2436]|nr:hypothetical protein T492DRAFT_891348 [Pavlovales sp. CCMP2436]
MRIRLQRDWRVHRGESDGGNALVAVVGGIPTLVIDGPFKLEVPPSNSLLLQGRGAPAACWPAGGGGLQKIDYHWTHEQTEKRALYSRSFSQTGPLCR